jgi:hypothetical protein
LSKAKPLELQASADNGLSPKTQRTIIEILELLCRLPPGRYRAILSLCKFKQPRGVERIDGLVQHALDVRVVRPRRLGAARARRALPPGEP